MSEQVNRLIDEIRGKSVRMREQIEAERATNATLTTEIATLKNEISKKQEAIQTLEGTIADLNGRIETMAEQGVDNSKGKSISNEEIDALVKEIEYCIGQLKR